MAPSKKGAPISRVVTYALSAAIAGYALCGGRQAGMLPVGAGWRFFSWHPFFMVASISLSTVAALMKKLGGYTNTQIHGALSFASVVAMAAGYYVIWANKEAMNKPHITSNHSYAGVGVMLSYCGLLAIGLLGLHPDFGVLKTNSQVRFAHKKMGQLAGAVAMATAGLKVSEMVGATNLEVKAIVVAPMAAMAFLLYV